MFALVHLIRNGNFDKSDEIIETKNVEHFNKAAHKRSNKYWMNFQENRIQGIIIDYNGEYTKCIKKSC